MTGKNKEFMTSREAAAALGVALSTVQLWTNNGLLKAWTTGGGHRRIARGSVEKILAEQSAVISSSPYEAESLTVVVVEDQVSQRRLYQQQFEARKLPVRLIMANNGFEGLLQIGKYSPNVIITDLKMPNMDGFQMIAALTEQDDLSECLTIAVTSLDPGEIKSRGGLPEDVIVLSKPIPFDQLESLLLKKLLSIRDQRTLKVSYRF